MLIHQIFISDGDDLDNMSEYLKENIRQLKKYYPESSNTYNLYNGKTLRTFIKNNFDKEVLWAYDFLNPYTFKGDLGKFCLLYILGGLYCDLGIRINNFCDFDNSHYEFLAFRDVRRYGNYNNSYAVCNGLIYSTPGNIIFKECINQIVENCKNHFYGITPIEPTGPILFGQKIAQHISNRQNCHFGDFIDLTPDRENLNSAFILNDGFIFAFYKGFITFDKLAKNTNSYPQMWQDKCVYGTPRDRLNFLYKKYLNREVDEGGLNVYASIHYDEVEQILLNSEEYRKIKNNAS